MTKSKSLLISVVLGIFVMVACLCGFAGCSTASVTGIKIENNFQNAIKVGATLDTEGLIVRVVYSNNTTKELKSTDFEITKPDTSTIGKKVIKAKYTYNEKDYFAESDVWVYGDFVKLSVDEDSYVKQINRNDTFNTDTLIVYAEYECDTTAGNYKKKLATGDYTISSIDTSVAGDKTITISYTDGEITKTVDIVVNVVSGYSVTSFDMPDLITKGYNVNSQVENTYTVSGSTGVKGFEVTGAKYKVGSYNKFWFQPKLSVMSQSNAYELTEFPMSIKFYKWENSEYTELAGTELNNMVTYDANKHWIQFTANANNKQFKIEAYPADALSAEEQAKITALTFEFEVVDGFNVYNAADLSAIDNENMQGKWTDLKNAWIESGAANGDLFNVKTNTFILHNDVKITDDVIPAVQFWTEGEVAGAADAEIAAGSLKDSASIESQPYAFVYKRYVKARANGGDTFKLEGNYFKISAQDLKLIVREGDTVRTDPKNAITTHTSLFCIMANEPLNVSAVNAKVEDKTYSSFAEAEKAVSAKAEFNNTWFIGNSGKSEDALVSGGILMTKLDKIISEFNNCLTERWFIPFFTQRDDYTMAKEQFLTMTINKTNAFDAYNTMIYNWGGSVAIKDSHLIGAGGPIMISDHLNETDSNGGSPSDVVVDQNSVMESYVVGTEGWFVTYPAASLLMSNIKAQNVIFQTGISNGADTIKKTFCDSSEKLNLIAAFKAGSAQDATKTPINARFTKEGASVNLELKKGDTYEGIFDLVVISGMLSNDTIKNAVENYMAGKNIGRYDALKEMIAFANTPKEQVPAEMQAAWTDMQAIKNAYDANKGDDEKKTMIQGAVSQGIVYVGTNGLVCMPEGIEGWVVKPNADLFKEAQGTLYAYVNGNIGAILTISDYTAPSA